MSNKDYLIKVLASYFSLLHTAATSNEVAQDKYRAQVKQVDQSYGAILLILKTLNDEELESGHTLESLKAQFPVIQ